MRLLLAALIAAAAAPGAAADRRFTITSFDRIRLDGPFAVSLKTNNSPYATARGTSAALDRVIVEMQGRTLVVRRDRNGWGGDSEAANQPVEIALGTHELSAAWVNGSGSLTIDKVRGLKFDLAIAGAGSVDIASADVDQLKIGLAGSATATLSGKALRLAAGIDGSSELQASELVSQDAFITASGPASVQVAATQTAKVNASGAATISLRGRPACTNRLDGSATVSGCK